MNVLKKVTIVILLFFITKGFGQNKNSQLNITIDERIETLYSVAFFNDYFLITDHENIYKEKLAIDFKSLKHHRAVRLFDTLSTEYNFTFNRTVQWALQFSDFPKFEKIRELKEDNSIVPKQKQYLLQEFRKELISFNQDSLFQEYLEAVKPINQKIIAQVQKSNTIHNTPKFLEEFYGNKLSSYNLIISPLIHSGGFNVELYNKSGEQEVFGLIGPNGEIEFVPYFDKDYLEMNMVLHEFGHSFIDYLITANSDAVNKLKNKYFDKELEKSAKSQGYNNWENVFNELILRATTIKITENNFGEKEANALLEFERQIGFGLVDKIEKIINDYVENRDKYKSFKDFFPVLLERMN